MARRRRPIGGGGSFLGTAAAAAAGVVGGSLLLGGIRSMMGGSHHGFGDPRRVRRQAAQPQRRGAINPAATWRATPGSTTSARPPDRADDSFARRTCSIPPRTMTTDDRDDMDLDADDFGGDGDSDYA